MIEVATGLTTIHYYIIKREQDKLAFAVIRQPDRPGEQVEKTTPLRTLLRHR